MLTRVQIRAAGPTAHSVEEQLIEARYKVADALGMEFEEGEQVVEGTPGKGFVGRFTFALNPVQDPHEYATVQARVRRQLGDG